MIERSPHSHISESECRSLVDVLRLRRQHSPDQLAYQFLVDGHTEGTRLTYRQLDDQAQAIAARLRAVVRRGDRALLLFPPGHEFLLAFFGCLRAGVIAVPLPPPDAVRIKRALPRLESVIRDAKASAVLTTSTIAAMLRSNLEAQDDFHDLVWISTESITADEPSTAGDGDAADPLPGDIAFLQYTSGSTSAPKGVMVSHSNVIHQCRSLKSAVCYDDQSVTCTWMPYHHDYGLIEGLILPLFAGAPCYFLSPIAFIKRPHRWLEAISNYRVTHSQAPNFAYDLCVRKVTPQQRSQLDLRHWEVAAVGAEPVRIETLNAFYERFEPCGFRWDAFTPAYGLAESTLAVTYTPPGEGPTIFRAIIEAYERGNLLDGGKTQCNGSRVRSVVSCGCPMDETQVEVVNPESRIRCSEGEVGEIWVAGPSVAEGYWNHPEETERIFHARLADADQHSFLRTGDLGCLSDGRLYVTGREKDMMIIRGLNHYPHDIEQTVEASHPALRPGNGAAFSVEVDREEELVVVYEVQRRHLRDLNTQSVFAAIRETVFNEHDLRTHAIALWEPGTVPKTTSGKIQRRSVKAAFLAEDCDAVAKWQAASVAAKRAAADPLSSPLRTMASVRARIITRLPEITGIDPMAVDPATKFADLGVDSLRATDLASDLERWLGERVDPTIFWNFTTIDALAAHLAIQDSDRGCESRSPGRGPARRDDRHSPRDAIAIVGMGCRFPGGVRSPAEYWRLLRGGIDAISEIPSDRWTIDDYYDSDRQAAGKMYVRHGGFVDNIDRFDASFFGITPREAEGLDPQQRLLLEVAWESLEDAGIAPLRLRGSEAGVFVGLSSDDFAQSSRSAGGLADIDAYKTLGTARSIAAGRIAYTLDVHGPVVQFDTACSSSLVAIYQACQSLQAGECDLAIAGGVSLMLSPETMIALCKLTALASDGHCKAFDAAADGYVRGEGCGVLTLKRTEDAVRDGDTILATIRSAAVNHDGASNGLAAPNGQSQQRLLRKAIQKAGVDGRQVTYVEAHGTGTELGDPIELAAIDAAYNQGRSLDQPLLVGSTKGNIGHLEAAAGIAGLIKVVLMLQHQEIPPQLNFNTPNPHVPWDRMALKVPTELQPWQRSESPRRAAVSSFGFSGTNAHMIVEEAGQPEMDRTPGVEDLTSPPQLLTLTAQNQESLLTLAVRYIQHIESHPDQSIGDICFTAATGRDHFKHRLAVVASSRDELLTRLRAFASGEDESLVVCGTCQTSGMNAAAGIGFLFTGQGTQYVGMGGQLYQSQPVFRDAIDRCGGLLRGRLDLPLTEILYGQDEAAGGRLDQTINTQPAMFALQYALAELWKSWGIEPAAVIGHSSGEYAAACAAGVIDLDVALELVTTRGRLINDLPETGAMAVVMADEIRVQTAIGPFGQRVSIAAVNGPENIVISGQSEAVEQLLSKLTADGIDSERLNASNAGHSALVDPMLEPFRAVAETFQYAPPRIAMISTVSGELAGGEVARGAYWAKHVRERVRFASGMKALAETGCRTFVEIGPNPNLLAMGMACVKGLRPRPRWLPSLTKDRGDWETILYSLAELYVGGVDIEWAGFYRPYDRHRIRLPTYAFDRRLYPLPRRLSAEVEGSEKVERPEKSLLPEPQMIAATLDRFRDGLEDESRALTVRLDEVAIRFVIDALEQLGCVWHVGSEFTQQKLISRIPEQNRPKVLRVLSRLVERGLLDHVDGRYRVRMAASCGDAEEMLGRLQPQADYPECSLMRRAGLSLASLWKGDVEPLSILFPGGDTDQAAAFYCQSRILARYNEMAGEALREAVSRLPAGTPLRVLEVGAGTGGLTTFLLPQLPAERSEYVFTDLSPLFLHAAQQRFCDFPFLSTRLLDIGKPPQTQGFIAGSFDLVVAANVLHATPRLHDSLGHVRQLLKPGGWLMLLEGANPPLWGDMVFTLMDGWWNFRDTQLRPDYPLMRRDRWAKVLGESHFEKVAYLNDAKLEDDSQNTLFLARTNMTACRLSGAIDSFKMPVAATVSASSRAIEHHRGPGQGETAREVTAAPVPKTDARDRIGDTADNVSDRQRLRELVRDQAARVMRLKAADIELSQPLSELGLDSLMATELRARLGQTFGRELSLNTLQMRRSIDEIAAYVQEDQAGREATDQVAIDAQGLDLEFGAPRAHLIPLQPVGTEAPLFFIPAGYGDLFAFQQISHAIGTSQPVYGLQPASAKRVKTVRQMSIYRLVSAYITEIKKVQPEGPYLLSGYSAGAIIAVELARELKRQGEEIGLLVIFDPPSHVPFWLDHFYEGIYRVTVATGLIDLVGKLRSRFARRLFHAVLDEGLRTHTSVTRQHRVAPYPGRITHFRARLSQSSLVSMKPVGPFWRRAAQGGIEVHWIPGSHYGVLRGPGASVVVDELRDCLQRAKTSHAKTNSQQRGGTP